MQMALKKKKQIANRFNSSFITMNFDKVRIEFIQKSVLRREKAKKSHQKVKGNMVTV